MQTCCFQLKIYKMIFLAEKKNGKVTAFHTVLVTDKQCTVGQEKK